MKLQITMKTMSCQIKADDESTIVHRIMRDKPKNRLMKHSSYDQLATMACARIAYGETTTPVPRSTMPLRVAPPHRRRRIPPFRQHPDQSQTASYPPNLAKYSSKSGPSSKSTPAGTKAHPTGPNASNISCTLPQNVDLCVATRAPR